MLAIAQPKANPGNRGPNGNSPLLLSLTVSLSSGAARGFRLNILEFTLRATSLELESRSAASSTQYHLIIKPCLFSGRKSHHWL